MKYFLILIYLLCNNGLKASPYWLEKYEVHEDVENIDVVQKADVDLNIFKRELKRKAKKNRIIFFIRDDENIIKILNSAQSPNKIYSEFLLSSQKMILVITNKDGNLEDIIVFEIGNVKG